MRKSLYVCDFVTQKNYSGAKSDEMGTHNYGKNAGGICRERGGE